MLKVTVELVPFGLEDVRRTISVIEIANIGGTREFGDYRYTIKSDRCGEVEGSLEKFDRNKGAIELLRVILNKEQLEENK